MTLDSIRVVIKATITQQPTEDFPGRNRTLIYNFITDYEATDGWQELTDTCRLTLPKNVYIRDITGRLISLVGPNVNIGGFGGNDPLFLRGDAVQVEAGYRFFDGTGNETLLSSIVFSGYIKKVASRRPIMLECEDNMYLLKQISAPAKTYSASTSMEAILKDMIAGTGFTVNTLTDTTLGEFTTQNETVGEVLARLQKDYHFYAYFRGTELRVGSQVYIEQDAIDAGRKVFRFQSNIISDDLVYNRTDDLELSAVAYSINKVELQGAATRSGKHRKRHRRLEALVTLRNGKLRSFSRIDDSNQSSLAPNVNGERRTLYFWNVTSLDKLVELAAEKLKRYYYDGLRGKFVTFGVPFVQQGNNVDIIDPQMPERNGRYKVKSVKYTGGVQGLRQEIELDYLITRINERGDGIS